MSRLPPALIACLGVLTWPAAGMVQSPPVDPMLFEEMVQPDVALPSVTLPPVKDAAEDAGSVAIEGGEEKTHPVAETAAVASVAAPAQTNLNAASNLSIGNFEVSLMYSHEDINNLRQVLAIYETQPEKVIAAIDNGAGTPQDNELLAELLHAKETEQAAQMGAGGVLPSFYLGTIIFDQPGQWSVWINRQPLTTKKPEDATLGITVIGVSNNAVTLKWKPPHLATAIERWAKIQETPELQGRKHREGSQASVKFDETAGEFTIFLHPNQTFVGETMQVLEGKITGLSIAAEAPPADAQVGGAPTSDNPVAENAGRRDRHRRPLNERQAADKLIENTMKLKNLVPQADPLAP